MGTVPVKHIQNLGVYLPLHSFLLFLELPGSFLKPAHIVRCKIEWRALLAEEPEKCQNDLFSEIVYRRSLDSLFLLRDPLVAFLKAGHDVLCCCFVLLENLDLMLKLLELNIGLSYSLLFMLYSAVKLL